VLSGLPRGFRTPNADAREGSSRDFTLHSPAILPQTCCRGHMSGVLSCCWCEQPFQPRQTGGRMQRFCRPSCRRAFHAVVRSWALNAITDGTLSIEEIRSGPPATRALRRSELRRSPLSDTGSPDHALSYLLVRFVVEVPRSTIEGFVKFGFIRLDQQDDLAAIMGALRLLGEAPVVWRIA
jgi:hypothetical protein